MQVVWYCILHRNINVYADSVEFHGNLKWNRRKSFMDDLLDGFNFPSQPGRHASFAGHHS